MKSIDALIEVFKQVKEDLEKAIKPGPTLDYSKMNQKPDRAAQEAAAPTINYGGSRMATPTYTGAADKAAAVRSKLDAESKETALQTMSRRQGMAKDEAQAISIQDNPNSLEQSEAEPHDDPKHEAKEKAGAKKIKEEAQEILDLHKDESCIKAHSNGQWYLEKATETVDEFKARGGKVDKVPASNKGRPKTFDAKPTKSVSGVYNTAPGGYAKGTKATPEGVGKVGRTLNKEEDADLEKDNSVKPFGQNIYNAKANVGRKMGRTGEVVEGAGRNNAVQSYTTSGSSMQSAHETAQAKEMKAKTKASTRTLKDMSPEELKAIQDKQGKK